MADRVWRWQADYAWHYSSSMFYETHLIGVAANEFIRYHHVRACLYFGVSAVEAFLNQEMRRHLKQRGATEDVIFKKVRYTKIDHKRQEWPSELCGCDVTLPAESEKVFTYSKGIRDEVTHPKREDHSIYLDLDAFDARALTEAVALTIVSIHEGLKRPFPYWVLGWNFVGLNGDAALPMEANNLNAFYPSLQRMFDLGPYDVRWDERNMTTVKQYRRLRKALDAYPHDIEPYVPRFPSKPRLTRRWWDHEFIRADVQAGQAAYEEEGGRIEDQFGPVFIKRNG